MPFVPRLPPEVLQKMRARTVGSSADLTDLSEGGVLGSVLGTVAEEISSTELRLQDWVSSFFLDASGSELDDRVSQLPKEFPRRRGQRSAVGGLLTVTRVSSVGDLTIPVGGLVVGRSDQANLFYTNTSEIVWVDGQSVAPGIGQDPVQVRCVTRGVVGNGEAGVINIVRSPVDKVRSVTSSQPLISGSNGESDEEVVRRARLWVSSLMGWTPRALEGLAMNYANPTTGDAIRNARAVTDPANPGYTKLIIDDGFAMVGFKQLAAETGGTVPTLLSGSRYQFNFDYPAAGDVKLTLDGTTYGPSSTDWIAVLERGVLITAVSPGVTITPGTEWAIKGHQVYTGLIAEIQDYLDDIAIGSGLRVQVCPPRLQYVTITANCVVTTGYNRQSVFAAVTSSMISYFVGLSPGEPGIIFDLCAALKRVAGVDNVIFDRIDGWYPGSLWSKLATTSSRITLR